MPAHFLVRFKDPATSARSGTLTLSRGEIQTPAFMPVGTQATVKTLTPDELLASGVEILLSNTYHLYLRPGHERVRRLGGLHRFMAWDRPILTDSGGYQVFSLARLNKVLEEGVRFQSHLDGSRHFLSPAGSIDVQLALGSDVIMALDTLTPYPGEWRRAREDMERTTRWAVACAAAWRVGKDDPDRVPAGGEDQSSLFGIVQGGLYPDLRRASAEALRALDLPGYAIGGLAVGEPMEECMRVLAETTPHLPEEKPRYLMGVGRPEDILEAVERGVDLFDCVLPTRNARKGSVFTSRGKLVIKNAGYADDTRPIDPECACPVCRTWSRAYLRHLFAAGEILGLRLATLHSLHYYQTLMREIRAAVQGGNFGEYKRRVMERLRAGAE